MSDPPSNPPALPVGALLPAFLLEPVHELLGPALRFLLVLAERLVDHLVQAVQLLLDLVALLLDFLGALLVRVVALFLAPLGRLLLLFLAHGSTSGSALAQLVE